MTIKLPNTHDIQANVINTIVTSHVGNARIKRFDVGKEYTELVYLINITNYEQLELINNELDLTSKDISYSFVEEAKIF